jgi:hypothetical protein
VSEKTALWREMDSNRPQLGLVVRDTGADLYLWFRLYRLRWAYPEQVQWLRRSRKPEGGEPRG